jgi:hypothetical protein
LALKFRCCRDAETGVGQIENGIGTIVITAFLVLLPKKASPAVLARQVHQVRKKNKSFAGVGNHLKNLRMRLEPPQPAELLIPLPYFIRIFTVLPYLSETIY